MATQYDAIVIGAGQAGPPLAARLTQEGMRVALIERKLFGGTCVNTGCTPTKTLVASARAAHMARRGGDFGVVIRGGVAVDMPKVKARKDEVVRRSNRGVETWLKTMDRLSVHEGHARFESANHIRVGDTVLQAPRIFVNVGGRAAVPDIAGIRDVPFLTNTGMMEVDFLPEHLVVIGGSYIGLEFAQMYRRFGAEVTVVEMGDRLISRDDEDISATVKEILEREGIAIRLGAKCLSVARRGVGIAVGLDCADAAKEVVGSHLLLATGRVPNTDDLGLEAAGVAVDKRGYITVDDELRTNVPGIWALGDCNGRGAFTHTSYNDYEIVAANLFDAGKRRVSDRIATYALYIDPPLGRAGMTEREARATGRKLLIGRLDMTSVSRARERGEMQGFMKVVVDAESERILGAAMLGIEADEVVQSVLDVMYAGTSWRLIQRAVYIHPTVTELLPSLLENLEPAS